MRINKCQRCEQKEEPEKLLEKKERVTMPEKKKDLLARLKDFREILRGTL